MQITSLTASIEPLAYSPPASRISVAAMIVSSLWAFKEQAEQIEIRINIESFFILIKGLEFSLKSFFRLF